MLCVLCVFQFLCCTVGCQYLKMYIQITSAPCIYNTITIYVYNVYMKVDTDYVIVRVVPSDSLTLAVTTYTIAQAPLTATPVLVHLLSRLRAAGAMTRRLQLQRLLLPVTLTGLQPHRRVSS
jgi:hypothetical protein